MKRKEGPQVREEDLFVEFNNINGMRKDFITPTRAVILKRLYLPRGGGGAEGLVIGVRHQ